MTNKMTNKKALIIAINQFKENGAEPGLNTIIFDGQGYDVADVVSKLENMVASLENKATSANRKPTAKQVENVHLRRSIMGFLRENPNRLLTCTEIGKEVKELDGMNNQRISALMRGLVDSGEVVKIVEKGKSLFQLAKSAVVEDEGEDEDEGE